MMRQKRVKLIRQALINKLASYDRRIQKMAENAYKIRQFIETLDAKENEGALHQDDQQGSIGSGSLDNGTGGADVSDSTVVAPVLEEQPAELPNDSGDIGVDAGSPI